MESSPKQIFEILSKMYPNARCELNYSNMYELAVAVMLSAQTTDNNVNKVTPLLFEKYPSIQYLAHAKKEDVMSIIKSIGLYKNKANNIIAMAQKLLDDHYDMIPNDYNYLLTLPGIGRKTANVILSEGYKVPRIAVDTHVFRVANRLGLSNSKDVFKVENDLMNLYPEALWSDVHLKLLFFGRYFCKAIKPECESCPFKDICKK